VWGKGAGVRLVCSVRGPGSRVEKARAPKAGVRAAARSMETCLGCRVSGLGIRHACGAREQGEVCSHVTTHSSRARSLPPSLPPSLPLSPH